LEVRLADLPSDKVSQFLAGAGSEMRNPYDNQPFNWDSASRSMSFEPMNRHVWPGWKFKAAVPPLAPPH